MRNGYCYAAFTARGEALAERLAIALGGEVNRPGASRSLSGWTEQAFLEAEALIFVGAAGIAVRAIAPFLRGKAEDPAVLVVDELGTYVIPILSGHLGGANALAREIAAVLDAEPVITTATDLHGLFAVDLWAKRQGLQIRQPERIKLISAKVLGNLPVTLQSRWPIAGDSPVNLVSGDDADIIVDYRDHDGPALQLVPHILVLGVGCRRGITEQELEIVFSRFCAERKILPEAITAVASIDRKQNEAGLLAFCSRRRWPLYCFSASVLRQVPGSFTVSAFVEEQVGVDNVCERAAVLVAGGRLAEGKYASGGITFALAEQHLDLDWST